MVLLDNQGSVELPCGETPSVRMKKMIVSDANQIKLLYGKEPNVQSNNKFLL